MFQVLFPKTIETQKSKFNGTITIQKFLGKYSINTDNLTQTGGLVTTIWKKAFRHLDKRVFPTPPKQILILGLGGGGVIDFMTKKWQASQITGIEIDPIMIDLGKKYFKLDDCQNLNIVRADAIRWLQKNHNNFDLILIDLYIGRTSPEISQTENFFKSIKDHLNPQGAAVFNRLVLSNQKKEAKKFKSALNRVFPHTTRIPTPVNWLLLCQS